MNDFFIGSIIPDKEIEIGKIETDYKNETDHSKLDNLDFEHSGHTGFQKAGDYATYEDLMDFVSFSTKQKKTLLQQERARENIGSMVGWKDLGYIDLEQYDSDICMFFDTLLEEGFYKFYNDEFNYNIIVYKNGNNCIGQEYWSSEEGIAIRYFRTGNYYNNKWNWTDLDSYVTFEGIHNNYAQKTHSHYTQISTSQDIRVQLNNFYSGMYKIRNTITNDYYIYEGHTIGYKLNNSYQYVYYQEYFNILEPDKIYKRKGIREGTTSAQLDWDSWFIFEGRKEE